MAEEQLQRPLTPTEIAKKEAWGNMGVAFLEKETQLQLRAQQSINKLIIPTTIAEIATAEAALRVVISERNQLKEDRKTTTKLLDGLIGRAMIPEESFGDPIAKATNAIIELKKQKRDAEALLTAIEEEKKYVKEAISTQAIVWETTFGKIAAELINTAYGHALDNISIEQLPQYLNLVESRITVAKNIFAYHLRPLKHLSIEEVKIIEESLNIIEPITLVNAFKKSLKARFSDYQTALKNKEAAKAISTKETEESALTAFAEAENKTLAVQLESQSEALTLSFDAPTKALKAGYEIDMPDTIESVAIVMRAFLANFEVCKKETTVKKWLSGFTAESAGKALCKFKNKDNNFAPIGVVFKTVDKL